MTNGPSPMCMECTRLHEDDDAGLTCEAYPEGIPFEIYMNAWDHRYPKPGHGGLQFVPREGTEPQSWWPDEAGLPTSSGPVRVVGEQDP